MRCVREFLSSSSKKTCLKGQVFDTWLISIIGTYDLSERRIGISSDGWWRMAWVWIQFLVSNQLFLTKGILELEFPIFISFHVLRHVWERIIFFYSEPSGNGSNTMSKGVDKTLIGFRHLIMIVKSWFGKIVIGLIF